MKKIRLLVSFRISLPDKHAAGSLIFDLLFGSADMFDMEMMEETDGARPFYHSDDENDTDGLCANLFTRADLLNHQQRLSGKFLADSGNWKSSLETFARPGGL